MSLPTFYIPPEQISGDTAFLTGDELYHARTTLRLGSGDSARLIDGEGGSLEARFRTLTNDKAVLDIQTRTVEMEPAFTLAIAMGIVKGERYEWAVQKGTELGATTFIPLVTERTEVKVRKPWKRMERLQRIMVSACKQCGRARFPTLLEPVPLTDLDTAAYDLAVAFWEADQVPSLAEAVKGVTDPGSCLMIIGPVGGFSTDEAQMMKRKGCVLAALGPRILRTETAVTAGATLLQHMFGDMK